MTSTEGFIARRNSDLQHALTTTLKPKNPFVYEIGEAAVLSERQLTKRETVSLAQGATHDFKVARSGPWTGAWLRITVTNNGVDVNRSAYGSFLPLAIIEYVELHVANQDIKRITGDFIIDWLSQQGPDMRAVYEGGAFTAYSVTGQGVIPPGAEQTFLVPLPFDWFWKYGYTPDTMYEEEYHIRVKRRSNTAGVYSSLGAGAQGVSSPGDGDIKFELCTQFTTVDDVAQKQIKDHYESKGPSGVAKLFTNITTMQFTIPSTDLTHTFKIERDVPAARMILMLQRLVAGAGAAATQADVATAFRGLYDGIGGQSIKRVELLSSGNVYFDMYVEEIQGILCNPTQMDGLRERWTNTQRGLSIPRHLLPNYTHTPSGFDSLHNISQPEIRITFAVAPAVNDIVRLTLVHYQPESVETAGGRKRKRITY